MKYKISTLSLLSALAFPHFADAHYIREYTQEKKNDQCMRDCYSYFDSRFLSSPETKIVMQVKVSKDGIPECKILRSEHATKADEFYCEQAVWEGAPIGQYWKEFQGAETTIMFPDKELPTFNWNELLKHRKRNQIVMHLVPAYAEKYKCSTKDFGDTPDNAVSITTSKLDKQALKALRLEWVRFFLQQSVKVERPDKSMITSKIRDKARHIRQKYGALLTNS